MLKNAPQPTNIYYIYTSKSKYLIFYNNSNNTPIKNGSIIFGVTRTHAIQSFIKLFSKWLGPSRSVMLLLRLPFFLFHKIERARKICIGLFVHILHTAQRTDAPVREERPERARENQTKNHKHRHLLFLLYIIFFPVTHFNCI